MIKHLFIFCFIFSSVAWSEQFTFSSQGGTCTLFRLNVKEKKWQPIDSKKFENRTFTIKQKNVQAELVYFAANGAWHAVINRCARPKAASAKISIYTLLGYQTSPMSSTDSSGTTYALTEKWYGAVAGAQYTVWEKNSSMFSLQGDVGVGKANVNVNMDQPNPLQYRNTDLTTLYVRIMPKIDYQIGADFSLFLKAGGVLRYGKYGVPPGYSELPGTTFMATYGLGFEIQLQPFNLILEGGAVKDPKYFFVNAGLGFPL